MTDRHDEAPRPPVPEAKLSLKASMAELARALHEGTPPPEYGFEDGADKNDTKRGLYSYVGILAPDVVDHLKTIGKECPPYGLLRGPLPKDGKYEKGMADLPLKKLETFEDLFQGLRMTSFGVAWSFHSAKRFKEHREVVEPRFNELSLKLDQERKGYMRLWSGLLTSIEMTIGAFQGIHNLLESQGISRNSFYDIARSSSGLVTAPATLHEDQLIGFRRAVVTYKDVEGLGVGETLPTFDHTKLVFSGDPSQPGARVKYRTPVKLLTDPKTNKPIKDMVLSSARFGCPAGFADPLYEPSSGNEGLSAIQDFWDYVLPLANHIVMHEDTGVHDLF